MTVRERLPRAGAVAEVRGSDVWGVRGERRPRGGRGAVAAARAVGASEARGGVEVAA